MFFVDDHYRTPGELIEGPASSTIQRRTPDGTAYRIIRGQVYRTMKRYDEALADLNLAIELNPGDAKAVASRGETYRRMKRYDEALADFNRAIELDPGDARAIAERAETYRLMQRYE